MFRAEFNGKPVAVKSVSNVRGNKLIEEGLLQSAFHDNPHLPTVQGVCWGPRDSSTQKLYLVMDRVVGLDLFTILSQVTEKRFNPVVAVDCFAGMAKGLVEMHKWGYIHGDIKLENVMLDQNNLKPRLIDFGMGYEVEERRRQDIKVR